MSQPRRLCFSVIPPQAGVQTPRATGGSVLI